MWRKLSYETEVRAGHNVKDKPTEQATTSIDAASLHLQALLQNLELSSSKTAGIPGCLSIRTRYAWFRASKDLKQTIKY